MNAKLVFRSTHLAAFGAILVIFGAASGAAAEASCNEEEAPELFVDMFSSTRIYMNGDSVLMGFATGVVWRPSPKCVHLAAEGFARFGNKTVLSEDIKMRTAGGALGALWGNGDSERWFGAGAMFDLGWGRVGAQDHFVMSGYLRALLYWRLRKEFWIGLDARAGGVIVPVTAGTITVGNIGSVTLDGIGIKGPMLGLGIGAMWGEGAYGAR